MDGRFVGIGLKDDPERNLTSWNIGFVGFNWVDSLMVQIIFLAVIWSLICLSSRGGGKRGSILINGF